MELFGPMGLGPAVKWRTGTSPIQLLSTSRRVWVAEEFRVQSRIDAARFPGRFGARHSLCAA
jgi:hypothetical protein